MNKLANNCFGKAHPSKELVIGADDNEVIDELYEGLKKFFEGQGLKVCRVHEDECAHEECDVVIYIMDDWNQTSVYMSPFRADGYCPNLIIALHCLTVEKILDQITGFLEAIKF